MKKAVLFLIALSLVFISGCEKVKEKGNYKEGTYYGYAEDTYGGKSNIASAVVYVDEDGFIKSVFIDTTYNTSAGGNSTKKALGDNYKMQALNPAASGEWYVQMNKLEKEIVTKQSLDFLTLDADGVTDTVAGVTIKIDAIKEALINAVNQAK